MGGEALKSRVFLTLTCLLPLLTRNVAPLLLAAVLPDTCPQQTETSITPARLKYQLQRGLGWGGGGDWGFF